MSQENIKRCDIVIPVWNHLDMTKECVDSITRHTHYPYRLILVDNASDIPTKTYLESLKAARPGGVVIIRNEVNAGFVKAVNQGMRYSDAGYLCIMNNDTLVTDGWLDEIVEIFALKDDIGIVNPSSNTSCQFPGKLSIDDYAATLRSFRGTYQELYTGRAFAMVVKRAVIDKIGYLDEIYGMGYFDDTDYCKRAQKLGYIVVRAKASYVYHKESQSFSKIKEKGSIFLENEKKFVQKWGRYLRVAYVVPARAGKNEEKRIASNISAIAKMGNQVWVFTTRRLARELNPIDHESIRFFLLPPLFFDRQVLHKIKRRLKKKPLHVILTTNEGDFVFFRKRKDALQSDVFLDSDFCNVAGELKRIAGRPL